MTDTKFLDFLEQVLEEGVDETVAYVNELYKVPEQKGPLRQFEKQSRCASRGCSSPTFFKLQGVSYCMIHCLRKMNEMLFELGVEK